MTIYLAWVRNAGGKPEPQVWRDLDSCETSSLKTSQRFVTKSEVNLLHEGLSVDELARLYPCPS